MMLREQELLFNYLIYLNRLRSTVWVFFIWFGVRLCFLYTGLISRRRATGVLGFVPFFVHLFDSFS